MKTNNKIKITILCMSILLLKSAHAQEAKPYTHVKTGFVPGKIVHTGDRAGMMFADGFGDNIYKLLAKDIASNNSLDGKTILSDNALTHLVNDNISEAIKKIPTENIHFAEKNAFYKYAKGLTYKGEEISPQFFRKMNAQFEKELGDQFKDSDQYADFMKNVQKEVFDNPENRKKLLQHMNDEIVLAIDQLNLQFKNLPETTKVLSKYRLQILNATPEFKGKKLILIGEELGEEIFKVLKKMF